MISINLSFTHMVNLNFSVNKQVGDKNGYILILDVNIDEIRYVLVKMFDTNTEVEQVQVLIELSKPIKNKFFGRKSYSFSWRPQCIF